MSRTIDERVVEMRFDNKQFEAGAKQTMGTLERLKKALRFPDVTKGFGDIQKASDKVDMNGLGSAIEGVKVKFSALEVAAITALSNIVNRAVDAGVRLAKSLSIDQVTAGFREYELKMGSIQTIMASTGESLETVNKRLEELNEYSDKTIYSFSDMTSNIGKFTNAGVKLDDAVKAIQGVSNVAAVSGANAQEASRAMYNFAQALSSGSVKRIDWRSIELANMSTVEFRQSLIDTAVAMGTLVKEGDKYQTTTTDLNGNVSELFDATSMFNDSLSAQWMTTDVLVQTLGNYSTDVRNMTDAEKKAYEEKLRGIGYTEEQIKAIEDLGVKAFKSAQDVKTFTQLIDTIREGVGSGWAQTFELIFGDFEEAKNLWTNVNNTLGAVIQASSDSRNELLKQWKKGGGRTALLDGITNSFNALLSVAKAVKEAFQDVFPKVTADQLIDISKGFRDLTSKLIPSTKAVDNLKRTFSGLFSILNVVRQAGMALFRLVLPWTLKIVDLGGGILSVTAALGDWTKNLDKTIRENKIFIKIVDKIHDVVGDALDVVDDFIPKLDRAFKILFNFVGINIDDVLNDISKAFKDLSIGVSLVNFKTVEKSFVSIKNKIKELFELVKPNNEFSTFVDNFKKYGEDLRDAFSLDNLLGRLERIMDVFGKFFNWVKTGAASAFRDFSVGSAIAASGGIGIIYTLVTVAKSFSAISKTFESFKVFPDLLGGVKDTLVAYQNDLKAETLIKIAKAIGIVTLAITVLSFADMKNAWQAATMIGLVGAALIAAFGYLTKAKNSANAADDAIRTIAETIRSSASNLTGSVRNLTDAVEKTMKRRSLASFFKQFAKSIALIFLSIVGLGLMWRKDQEAFKAGVASVAGITGALIVLGALFGVASKFANTSGMADISKSILMFAASLGLIVFAVSGLMKMKVPEDYEKHLDILYNILAGLAALSFVLSAGAWFAGGNQLPKMSGAIKSLTIMLIATVLSLKVLFGMKMPEDIEQRMDILKGLFYGLVSIVVAMGIAAGIANGQGFKAAGTILALIGFIVAVTASLLVLSVIPLEKLESGALAIGGILFALSFALSGAGKTVDKNAVKTVLGMALSIGVITAALSILSIVPWDKLLTSAVSLGIVLVSLSTTFSAVSKNNPKNSIPTIIAMTASLGVIAASIFILSSKPWEGVVSAAASLSLVIISLAGAFAIMEKAKVSVDTAVSFVAAAVACIPIAYVLQTISQSQNILQSAITLVAVVLALSGALSIISGIGPSVLPGTVAFVAAAVACIPIAYAMKMLSGLSWSDVATGLVTLAGALTIIGVAGLAFGAIAGPMIAGSLALGVFSLAVTAAGLAVVIFVASISKAIDLLGNLLDGLGNLSNYAEAGRNLIVGFIGGILEGFDFLIDTVKEIGKGVLSTIEKVLGINSPSTEMWQRGIYTDEGFALGVSDGSDKIDTAMQDVFGGLTDKINVEDFNLTGKDASTLFGSGFSSGENDISSMLSGVVQNANSGIDTSTFTNTGLLAGMDFSKGFEGMDPTSLSTFVGGVAGSVDTSSFSNTGLLAGMDFSKGFEGMDLSALSTSMSGVATNVDTSAFATSGKEASDKFIESFNSGLNSKQGQISSTIKSLTSLISESITSLSSPMIAAGRVSINNWITGMNSKYDAISAVGRTLTSRLLLTLQSFDPSFLIRGSSVASKYLLGIKNKYPEASSTGKALANKIILALRLSETSFLQRGSSAAVQYLIGIKNKYPQARSVGEELTSFALRGCRSLLSKFKTAGSDAGQGFIDGIKSKEKKAAEAGTKLAKSAYDAAKKELDEHSPSKKMGQVGDFAGLGFVQQLLAHVASSEEAGKKIGNAAYKGAISVISNLDDFDVDPTIHPRVDLEDVKKSVSDINRMFNESISYTAKMAASTSASVSSPKTSGEIQNNDTKATAGIGDTYQFVQNNYSPKALSRIDIYRGTRNQFSQFKEATSK